MRRRFLRAVGAGTALSAISTLFPLGAAREAFAQSGKLEKASLKIGFIPITCATPIIMSLPMGFYARQGLNVDVIKTAGWAVIRDKTQLPAALLPGRAWPRSGQGRPDPLRAAA